MKTISLYSKSVARAGVNTMAAIKTGLQRLGYTIREQDDKCDMAVICSTLWNGRMAPNREVFFNYTKSGRNVLVFDAGALNRGKLWRLGINAIHREGYFGPKGNDDTRRRRLGIELKPWKKNGKNLLICLQHSKSYQWRGQPHLSVWANKIVEVARREGWSNIAVRPHPRDPFVNMVGIKIITPKSIGEDEFDLVSCIQNYGAVVNFSSNVGIIAAIHGIPVFVGERSLAFDVRSGNLNNLKLVDYPDREKWINDFVYTEWTNEEIAEGSPISRLLEGKC